jgi:hypothetical protein
VVAVEPCPHSSLVDKVVDAEGDRESLVEGHNAVWRKSSDVMRQLCLAETRQAVAMDGARVFQARLFADEDL